MTDEHISERYLEASSNAEIEIVTKNNGTIKKPVDRKQRDIQQTQQLYIDTVTITLEQSCAVHQINLYYSGKQVATRIIPELRFTEGDQFKPTFKLSIKGLNNQI